MAARPKDTTMVSTNVASVLREAAERPVGRREVGK
jgi:hypothetical protein